MRMKIVPTAQIVTIIHKTGLNIDESKVLVLPVHSRETRLVLFETRLISFLSRLVSRETRRVSRDGGNILLTGTVLREHYQLPTIEVASWLTGTKKFTLCDERMVSIRFY